MITPWWLFKVVTGIWLVVDAVIRMVEPREPWLALPAPLWLAQSFVLGGTFIHLWHYGVLKRRTPDLAEPIQLVQNGGLFRFIRHPMYLGDLLFYLGLVLMTGEGVNLLVYSLAVTAIFAQCTAEDRQLAERFGAEFESWKLRTRLLIPIPVRWKGLRGHGQAGMELEEG